MTRVRIAIVGMSGAGKSTFAAFAEDLCTEKRLTFERIGLAAPLYHLQQQFRATAGVQIPADVQDQLLMESIADHLRRLHPRALVDPFLRRVDESSADVVLNDDLRDPDVDYPAMVARGFTVIRVVTSEVIRRARLGQRGDATTADNSTQRIHEIPADYVVENAGSLDVYRSQVLGVLETLSDLERT